MGWSDLPSDLVISIAAHLWEAGDHLRFRTVCRSWRSAVRDFRPSFFPWLAVIPRNADPKKNELSFISHVANKHVFKSPIPFSSGSSNFLFRDSHISNNKDGWMMIVRPEDGVAIIFNPVTSAQLQPLPSLSTLFDGIGGVFLTDNLFAFAVHHCGDDHFILAAAAPGDDTWHVINSYKLLHHDHDIITDVIFHEADHKFYAVHHHKCNLIAFCLTRCGGKTVVGQVSSLSGWESEEDSCLYNGPHLVSCGSNLLLVKSPSQWKEDFEILKYCPDAAADTCWMRMTNVDFGNNSLFIDSYGAKLLPLPQGDREGELKRNCIYLIHYKLDEEEEGRFSQRIFIAARIYDVNKGTVEPCSFCTDIESDIQSYPVLMWFMPSPSINN